MTVKAKVTLTEVRGQSGAAERWCRDMAVCAQRGPGSVRPVRGGPSAQAPQPSSTQTTPPDTTQQQHPSASGRGPPPLSRDGDSGSILGLCPRRNLEATRPAASSAAAAAERPSPSSRRVTMPRRVAVPHQRLHDAATRLLRRAIDAAPTALMTSSMPERRARGGSGADRESSRAPTAVAPVLCHGCSRAGAAVPSASVPTRNEVSSIVCESCGR